MKYKTGYIGFIDILGFSDSVLQIENGEKTECVFRSIKRIQHIFDSQNWDVKMAFFSDSVILTSENSYRKFVVPLYMIENVVREELGLLYRGGIVRGEYFHEDNLAFGPGLIKAYEIEKKAEESRVILDIEDINNGDWYIFRDYDGRWCFNPYSYRLWEEIPVDISEDDEDVLLKCDLLKIIFTALDSIRNEIQNYIISCQEKDDIKSSIIRKYIWRTIPFNIICDFLIKRIDEVPYLKNSNYTLSTDEIEIIEKLKFKTSDYVMEYVNF